MGTDGENENRPGEADDDPPTGLDALSVLALPLGMLLVTGALGYMMMIGIVIEDACHPCDTPRFWRGTAFWLFLGGLAALVSWLCMHRIPRSDLRRRWAARAHTALSCATLVALAAMIESLSG